MFNEMLSQEERECNDKIEKLVKEACSINGVASSATLLDHTIAHFYSAASIRGEQEQFGQILLRLILPAWAQALDSRLQLENEYGSECSLREHCNLLSMVFHFIGHEGHLPSKWNQRDGENLSWDNASEWLEVAASVERVEVDTSYFDDSILFCGTAYDYQRTRSLEISNLVNKLTVFNFVWGALETTVKLIDPPKVPKDIKPGGTGLIDRALYYLKTDYEPRSTLAFYRDTAAALNVALEAWQPILLQELRLEKHVSLSGTGLGIVKKIRNKFAHGAANMPEPNEYSDSNGLDAKVIELSTRILLYALQCLLIAHLDGTNFEIAIREDKDGGLLSEDVDFVLRSLHVKQEAPDKAQLLLFDL